MKLNRDNIRRHFVNWLLGVLLLIGLFLPFMIFPGFGEFMSAQTFSLFKIASDNVLFLLFTVAIPIAWIIYTIFNDKNHLWTNLFLVIYSSMMFVFVLGAKYVINELSGMIGFGSIWLLIVCLLLLLYNSAEIVDKAEPIHKLVDEHIYPFFKTTEE